MTKIEPSRARDWLGFLLLLAVLLPIKVWRASLPASFWVDESYSLLISHCSPAQMIEYTAADAHPPLFYFILKAWRALGSALGIESALLWPRLLSVLCGWLPLAALAWFGGRKLLGPAAGALAAWAIAGNAQAADFMKDIRQYSLMSPALFACFLMLLRARFPANPKPEAPPRLAWRDWPLWIAYAACATLALWMHLLSAILLFLLGLGWLAAAFRARRDPPRFKSILGFLGAQAVAAALFVPWLLRLRSQLDYLAGARTDWMTAADIDNWGLVFALWHPWGRLDAATPAVLKALGHPMFAVIGLGALSMGLPALAALWAGLFRRAKPGTPESRLLSASLYSLGLAIAFPTALCALAALDIARVFHGPRYPFLTLPCWALGLAGLSTWSAERLGWRRASAWALMLPWFGASAISQAGAAWVEGSGQMGATVAIREVHPAFLPAEGEPLLVSPSPLAPIIRACLPEYDVRPISGLGELPDGLDLLSVMDLNGWWGLVTPLPDKVALAALLQDVFAEGHAERRFPDEHSHFIAYRLGGLRHGKARELASRGFEPKEMEAPPEAAALAPPHAQTILDGWQGLEFGKKLDCFRWSGRDAVRLVFDRPLPAGDWVLVIEGFRHPYPEKLQPVRAWFEGEERNAFEFELPAGSIQARIRLKLERALSRPAAFVEHPVWVPEETLEGSTDNRKLGFMYRAAWIEPAAATPKPGEAAE